MQPPARRARSRTPRTPRTRRLDAAPDSEAARLHDPPARLSHKWCLVCVGVRVGRVQVCEWVYLYIFTFELCTKITAYGFIRNSGAYLRDAWCQLDFVVVSLAWIPIIFPSFGNYSVIRSVRALRPLRALKRVPGMPALVSAIMGCIPKMGNVAMLCAFIFLVFGIVGMELFKGALHYRCALPGYQEPDNIPSADRRRMAQLAPPAAIETSASAASRSLAASAISGREDLGLGGVANTSEASSAAMLAASLLASAGLADAPLVEPLLTHGAERLYAAASAAAAAVSSSLPARVLDRVSTRLRSGEGGEGGESGTGGAASRWGRRLKGQRESGGRGKSNAKHAEGEWDTGIACNPTLPVDGQCVAGQTCSYFSLNPSNDLESYDSVGVAMILLLQAITFDDFATSM